MRLLVLFCVVASAAAAPWYRHDDDFGALGDFFSHDHITHTRPDKNHLWMQVDDNTADQLFKDLNKHFPTARVAYEYLLVAQLPGYETKDIVVKGQPGELVIEAVKRKGHVTTTYRNVSPLPANLAGTDGRWSYENGVLTISFLLKKNTALTTESAIDSATEGATVSVTPTASASVSREELETEKPKGRHEHFGEGKSEADDMTRTPTNEISSNNLNPKGDVEFMG